jgi:hypothetical protein
MIKMSKTWQRQHEMLTLFLASSSPALPPGSSTAPSLPSLHLAPRSRSRSRSRSVTTIPDTYNDEEEEEDDDDDDDGDTAKPKRAGGGPAQANISSSSSITEPPPQKKTTGMRRHKAGTTYYQVPDESSPGTRTQSPAQAAQTAATLCQAFQAAGQNPATAKETRRQIRQQAREAQVYAQFQALLSQPKPPFARRRLLELKGSDPT